jgi:hypothetical protein
MQPLKYQTRNRQFMNITSRKARLLTILNPVKRRRLILSFCCATFSLALCVMAAEEKTQWLLQINVYSGRPDPVMHLTTNDMTWIKALLGTAEKAADKAPESVFRSRLGYRGIMLTEIQETAQNKTVLSLTQIRGAEILVESRTNRMWLKAKDATLERHLVGLARTNDVISKELYDEIQGTIESR